MNIVALSPFEIHRPDFGGAQRIFELLTRVQHDIIVLAPHPHQTTTVKARNLEIRYKKVEADLSKWTHWDTDIAAVAGEMFAEDVKELNPSLVILEHPWQVDAALGHKFLYDAHNNEAELKKIIYPEYAEIAAHYEQKALQANFVTYCSETDNIRTDSPSAYIPNGTHIPAPSDIETKNLLFVGSAHPPNVAAAIMLAALAPVFPDYQIIIAGECSLGVQSAAPNVALLGHVNEQTLDLLFRNAHAMINLITAGSGTSLKVARALSYGVPVISSKLGARGYEKHCIIAETTQGIIEALEGLSDPITYQAQRKAAREAATAYSWDSIGEKFNDIVMELAESK